MHPLGWAFTPDDRPSFIDILAILELVLLDAAVEDPIGRRIWKTFFFDTKQVTGLFILIYCMIDLQFDCLFMFFLF